MKTIYAIDLDGTLLNTQNELTEYSRNELMKLMNAGALIAYVTARSWHSAKKILSEFNFNCPCIVYNGGFIVDSRTGEPIAENYIFNNSAKRILSLYKDYEAFPLVYAKIENRERILWVQGTETSGIKRYLDSRKDDKRLFPVQSFDCLYQKNIIGITLIDTEQKLKPLRQHLSTIKDISPCMQPNVYLDNEFWLEVYSKQSNKYDATLKLKSMLGADRIVSFGDNVVDLEMFRASNLSVAVDNAKKEVLNAADVIIGRNDFDSVVKFIKYDYTCSCK